MNFILQQPGKQDRTEMCQTAWRHVTLSCERERHGGMELSAACRVYPNSTAEPDTQNTLAHADGRSGPVTVSFDAMALALELAALRSAGERASRREFALVRPSLLSGPGIAHPHKCHAASWQGRAGRLLFSINGDYT